MVGSCKESNEPSGSIKGGKFLDKLSDFWFLEDSASWNYCGFLLDDKAYHRNLNMLTWSFERISYINDYVGNHHILAYSHLYMHNTKTT